MKTDVNGCSTTARGQEQYERYYCVGLRGWRIQYDYRTADGRLFSCVARNLSDARRKRDAWLAGREEKRKSC